MIFTYNKKYKEKNLKRITIRTKKNNINKSNV